MLFHLSKSFRIITIICLLCNFINLFEYDHNNTFLKVIRIFGTIGYFLFVYGLLSKDKSSIHKS